MKQLKSLFGLAVVVGGFYLAWVMIPVYYNNYSFQDEMDNQARMASYSQQSDQEVAEILSKKAKELDIPLTPEMIHVKRSGANIEINAEYTVTIETPLKSFDLTFSPSTTNKRI